ncbi:MAG: VOC family protein [Gammaproteobacteria bacterium]|nr:VOC family protein [Gammaproteobacteria bacterium]
MNYWPRKSLASFAALSVFFCSATHADEQPSSAIDGTVIFFYYEDLESATRFYSDLLQLPITMDEDWVRIFQITPTSSVGLVQQGRGFHDVSADKPAMLSIVTKDVDEWYARLRDANVLIRRELPPRDRENEAGAAPVRGFIAEDPGGYTIEFFSWQDSPEN